MKTVEIKVVVENGKAEIDSVTGATSDEFGWHVLVKKSESETAVFRVLGADSASHAALVEVWSYSPPNDPHATPVAFKRDPETGTLVCFYTEPLLYGADFRIEVETSANANPVPRGGGHFRVLDEGGGLP
ncbi:hypothetical protein [Paraliomyxa miuraensis]|uniref:hypothetical protein n=1 Tax=Paraliomyxa miuraensis TaxID=376150 RepID=UPI002255AAA9|nr:hypothetical protein [Paraliomyxa miuraensis]MCX4239721.1 hypothetical protein [Paraliomyxa miuraensis]